MSSAFAQTLIGGGLAIAGGLIAAWWQTARADNVARRIRRAERYESALIELNARAAEASRQVDRFWRDNREIVLQGRRHERIDISNYDLTRQPLEDLFDHWYSVASPVILDSAIVDAFANLHSQMATHLFDLTSPAYSRGGIVDGKVNNVQFVEDLEAVRMAASNVSKQVSARVATLAT